MIKQIIKDNEHINANTRDITKLKSNFPHFFDKDGRFLIDRLTTMLKNDDITITKEGYELNFLGKSYARYESSTETETIISPLTSHNLKEENKNSRNMYIIGDNLDALKHLLNSYSRKIRCIYIDPPYNTGSDGFIYPDNFKFDSKILSDKMGIDEEEAERIIDMTGKSTHSAWLTFMYPRLVLARELLSDDGVIFISIDDNEQANLKLICDEIFGEENFVAIAPRKNGAGAAATNSDTELRKLNDYIYIYSKSNLVKFRKNIIGIKEYPYNDEYGKYELAKLQASGSDSTRSSRPNMYYEIYLTEDGNLTTIKDNKKIIKTILPEPSNGEDGRWIWKKDTFEEKSHKYTFYDGKTIYRKKYQDLTEDQNKYQVEKAWFDNFSNSKGTMEFDSLFNSKKIFSYPKPIDLIKTLINLSSSDNESLILDFFSGSATTAHAVMQLNAEDGGNRKYILVQLPEKIDESKPAYKAGYKTIDEIGRERIKRAAKKIKEDTNANIDYGFKVVKLKTIPENSLDKLDTFNPNILITDNYIDIFSDDDSDGLSSILTTWLNQDGYGLSAKWSNVLLNNYNAQNFENSLYLIEEGIESEDIRKLIEKIENMELNINRIVIYPYSFTFAVLSELKNNIKNLRHNKEIKILERY